MAWSEKMRDPAFKKRQQGNRRAWYLKNKDTVLEKAKEYYAQNTEAFRLRNAGWYQANKEKAKALARKWYKENPERTRKNVEEWSHKHPGRRSAAIKAWQKRNPEIIRRYSRVAAMKRRAMMADSYHAGNNNDEVKKLTLECYRLTSETGEAYHFGPHYSYLCRRVSPSLKPSAASKSHKLLEALRPFLGMPRLQVVARCS